MRWPLGRIILQIALSLLIIAMCAGGLGLEGGLGALVIILIVTLIVLIAGGRRKK